MGRSNCRSCAEAGQPQELSAGADRNTLFVHMPTPSTPQASLMSMTSHSSITLPPLAHSDSRSTEHLVAMRTPGSASQTIRL